MTKSSELEPAMHAAVRAILRAANHMGADAADAARRVVDTASALDALDVMEQRLTDMPVSASMGSHGALLDIGVARSELLTYELARQRSMVSRVTESLTQLRSATTIDALADSIPVYSVGLGFERALFSWVWREHWIPHAMYSLNGRREAQATVAAGQQVHRHVRELLEVDVVRSRRTILVLDAMTNPRVHRQLHDVTQSQTYVAAPVIAKDHVMGLLHLDRNADTGTTDEFDRDLLMLFSQSVGAKLDQLLMDSSTQSVTGQPNTTSTTWADVLTEREMDVLKLVARGLTNAGIAARLFISEETAKTHVRKLLRKLGASNRSQAGAIYYRLEAVRGRTNDDPSNR